MQSKDMSLIEASVSTGCGAILVLVSFLLIRYFDIQSDAITMLLLALCAVLKNYMVRRAFNFELYVAQNSKSPLDQLTPYVPNFYATLAGFVPYRGGKKFDMEKIRWDLLPAIALEQVALVLTFGCRKYDGWNWLKGIEYNRLYRAAIGHIQDWWSPVHCSEDKETGLSHLAHAACCILFLLTYELLGFKHLDNRPTKDNWATYE